jgi:glutamate carboxypeptidase
MREMLAFLQKHASAILADIETLVRIESPSRDAAALNRVQVVNEGWWSPIGQIRRVPSSLGDALHVRIPGGSANRVLLLAHVDTVYPVGSWKEAWRIEGDRAFGPGTYDMKAGAVQALWAIKAIHDRGSKPASTIDLLLTPDEEIGSSVGRQLIEKLARGARAVLVLEAPFMNGDLKIARKGVGDYTIHVRGQSAHQGIEPEKGRNAIVSAAHLIQEIMKLQDMERGTTLGPNVMRGGTVSNVVADEAVLQVDLRAWTLPEVERVDNAIRTIQPLDGTQYEITGGLNRPPMEPSDGSMHLFNRAKALAAQLGFDVGAARVGGGSDGNFTSKLAPTLDGFGALGAHAHQKDLEYIDIPRLPSRTALLAGMLLET